MVTILKTSSHSIYEVFWHLKFLLSLTYLRLLIKPICLFTRIISLLTLILLSVHGNAISRCGSISLNRFFNNVRNWHSKLILGLKIPQQKKKSSNLYLIWFSPLTSQRRENEGVVTPGLELNDYKRYKHIMTRRPCFVTMTLLSPFLNLWYIKILKGKYSLNLTVPFMLIR